MKLHQIVPRYYRSNNCILIAKTSRERHRISNHRRLIVYKLVNDNQKMKAPPTCTCNGYPSFIGAERFFSNHDITWYTTPTPTHASGVLDRYYCELKYWGMDMKSTRFVTLWLQLVYSFIVIYFPFQRIQFGIFKSDIYIYIYVCVL